jgi:glycosyltransferase involved in cell wall biosynthesis
MSTAAPIQGRAKPGVNGGKSLRVAIVQFVADLNGSTISGRMTAQALLEAGHEVHVIFGAQGPGIQMYQRLGCKAHLLPHKNWLRTGGWRGWLNVARERRRAGRFAQMLGSIDPSVVCVNTLASAAGAIGAKRCGLPVVWHLRETFGEHGGEMQLPAFGGKVLVRRLIDICADVIISNSQATAEQVLGEGLRQRAKIVPNAVDDSFFNWPEDQAQSRSALGLAWNGPIIGVPGTLRPAKGHPYFLQTIPSVLEKRSDALVAIVGQGPEPYRRELNDLAARTGLHDRIRFLGGVDPMERFYRACDVICVPSRAETFGRVVVEAMAVGTPVVASAVGGIPEIIDDGRTGLLVPFGETASLSDALWRMLTDQALRASIASEAKRTALERYPFSVYRASMVSLIAGAAQPQAVA